MAPSTADPMLNSRQHQYAIAVTRAVRPCPGNATLLARMPGQRYVVHMTGNLLTVEHATAANTFSITSGIWAVAILAAASGAYLRWLAPIGIFVLYLITHFGGHGSGHLTGTELALIAVTAIGVYAGWHFGGRAMVRHVGEREYRNRIIGAKSISSIWSHWFSDPE